MWWRRDKGVQVDTANVDGIRGLYSALGLGFPPAVRRVFEADDDENRGSGSWCLRHLGRTVRCLRSPELSNSELFALPGTWEVVRVVARSISARSKHGLDRIDVTGTLYCRPAGTWENISLPFQHAWTMRAGRALVFENLIDATVLRPEDGLPAGGG
jgi:hypothetical protein